MLRVSQVAPTLVTAHLMRNTEFLDLPSECSADTFILQVPTGILPILSKSHCVLRMGV